MYGRAVVSAINAVRTRDFCRLTVLHRCWPALPCCRCMLAWLSRGQSSR